MRGFVLLALASLLLPLSPLGASEAVREVRVVMGTTAEVRVAGLDDPAPALDRAFAALALVDDQMSLWRESPLTRLNAAGSARVPAELFTVVRHALDVAHASAGAFDPTVEPLVRAAGGFGGPARGVSDGERQRLRARIGVRHVHLDDAGPAIRLDPGTTLDLGGIAKGYAADLALAALRAAGARSGLVDLGQSSIGVFGEPLSLDVRDPEEGDGTPWASFEAEEAAVSTSGGDQRAGHIFDPRTGLPAARVLSATVVAASGIEADALSTAVYVLGAEDGLRLLARRGAHGLVLRREKGRAVLRATPGFGVRFRLRTRADVLVEMDHMSNSRAPHPIPLPASGERGAPRPSGRGAPR